ncbi:hypothetical protein [Sulfurisphaera ohwakuensis]|uniref:Uncharacterized protein n=1 Tax=Sulfurisphaera ohwakuensis TaxID=69656 RepID=A0A650CK02_SULOH|nr:hypothetical protein [Sulfurisphaera ohwakuensis]MBB5254271.1 hypothetical protein [Sulfurisphaera ohwakuensis]QGR18170.1 hypothetical protein D1869_13965 [Sulfurisphaera ohwakuensis]
MDILEVLGLRRYKIIFSSIFILYFFAYQLLTRLIIITQISFPPGVYFVVSTSTPVPPSQMPFPLWGPFISITTPYFTWAMTPLSIGISLFLSLLVALNVTLYLTLYMTMRLKATSQILSSLGLIATALSCSCELFTGLIGSVAANIPFLVSITFMTTLFETLVILALSLLLISTFVLYNELNGKRLLKGISNGVKGFIPVIIFMVISVILPSNPSFSLAKFILSEASGGAFGLALQKKWKYGFLLSVILNILIFSLYPDIYTSELLYILPFISGVVGAIGYTTLKPWARLGILHVIAWSLIMPGPISLILGYPIPFFNLFPSQSLLLWITTWIIGTPLAWYAGIYYLQYLRDTMATKQVEIRISLPRSRESGITWIVIGGFMIAVQVTYFLTHVPYYVDYNGYDLIFLSVMTGVSTLLITIGSITLGYGIAKLINTFFHLPRPKNWFKWSIPFAIAYVFLAGVIHVGVYGYPYPPILLGLFGIPMFAPVITIYVPHIIGAVIYPLQILQLIASSMLAGAIASYTFENRVGKKGLLGTIIGSVAVCPACTLSSFSAYSVSILASALASTYVSNFVNSLQGQLILSFSSEAILLALLIYTGMKARRRLSVPKELRITR